LIDLLLPRNGVPEEPPFQQAGEAAPQPFVAARRSTKEIRDCFKARQRPSNIIATTFLS